MSCKHVLAHLRFAQRYDNWTINNWKRVIFSDETKVNRFNSNGRSWCWIEDGDCIRPQHVHHTVKHDGGSVMIQECMMAFGSGAWYKIEGRVDRQLYNSISKNFLWSIIIHNYNMDPSGLIFQHVNDPKHMSKIVQEWLASQPF